MAIVALSLAGSYLVWLIFLVVGTLFYIFYGRNAWYFQYRAKGADEEVAKRKAIEDGQNLFPAGSLKESLQMSARVWRTWALVWLYFTTFGGFVALTAWLPTYWHSYYGLGLVAAGGLTALYSLLASSIRILGGVLSDRLQKGGENTAILALLIMLVGAAVMTGTSQFQLAVPGEILLAVGMGVCTQLCSSWSPRQFHTRLAEPPGGLGAWERWEALPSRR